MNAALDVICDGDLITFVGVYFAFHQVRFEIKGGCSGHAGGMQSVHWKVVNEQIFLKR